MPQNDTDIQDLALVRELVTQAGIRGKWDARILAGRGELNRHWLIELTDGRLYVARVYGWPFPDPEPFDRYEKEYWLLEELAHRGAAVPEPFAGVRNEAGSALLVNYLEGSPLGEAVRDTAAEDAYEAWHVVGAALREVHEAATDLAAGVGVLVSHGIEPFPEGTWARWQLRLAQAHAGNIMPHHPEMHSEFERAFRLIEHVAPYLDQPPPVVLHGDPHPWNVMVQKTAAGWHCTGWLDWEFALCGDPDYDLMRSARSRLVDLGPMPKSFYEGYGRPADPLREAIYELGYYLHMADDSRSFGFRATYTSAWTYLKNLSARLDIIERLT